MWPHDWCWHSHIILGLNSVWHNICQFDNVIPAISHHSVFKFLTRHQIAYSCHYIVSMFDRNRVKQGSQVTWRSESLPLCTGINNSMVCEAITPGAKPIQDALCSALCYQGKWTFPRSQCGCHRHKQIETSCPNGYASPYIASRAITRTSSHSSKITTSKKKKVNDPGIADRCITMTLTHNSALFPVHTNVEKCLGNNASLPHSCIHSEEAGYAPTQCTALSVPEYRPVHRPTIFEGVPRAAWDYSASQNTLNQAPFWGWQVASTPCQNAANDMLGYGQVLTYRHEPKLLRSLLLQPLAVNPHEQKKMAKHLVWHT